MKSGFKSFVIMWIFATVSVFCTFSWFTAIDYQMAAVSVATGLIFAIGMRPTNPD